MIPSAMKSESILDFVRNKKKAEEGIVEPIYDLFPKFLAANLIVKMPQRVVLNIYQTFKITMLNVNTIRVRLNIIWTIYSGWRGGVQELIDSGSLPV